MYHYILRYLLCQKLRALRVLHGTGRIRKIQMLSKVFQRLILQSEIRADKSKQDI